MKLVKTFVQYKDVSPQSRESDLNIEVVYDPSERVVTEILRVWAYNYRHRVITDLTRIYVEQMGTITEQILESVDWWELYMEGKEVAA